jgi:hypothetical protein
MLLAETLHRRETEAAAAERMAKRDIKGEGATTAEARASSITKSDDILGPCRAKQFTLLPNGDKSLIGAISVLF